MKCLKRYNRVVDDLSNLRAELCDCSQTGEVRQLLKNICEAISALNRSGVSRVQLHYLDMLDEDDNATTGDVADVEGKGDEQTTGYLDLILGKAQADAAGGAE